VHGVEIVLAQASVDRYIGDVAILVHKLKDMENLDVLFGLIQMEDRTHLIGRSRLEEVNVADVAGEFGGGGHPTAASATIKDMNLVEVQDRLLKLLKELVRPRKMARDVMVYPVKTAAPEQTLEEAGVMLTRYNLNILPVLQEEKVTDLEAVVERAVRHGLGGSFVKEYMTTEFSVLTDAPFTSPGMRHRPQPEPSSCPGRGRLWNDFRGRSHATSRRC
jgi:tRNA nucleotidyltransferase (CCA-adding enzyme)